MNISVVAYLCCDGAEEAIAWYGRVFGASELSRLTDDAGRIGHAELRFGETTLYLSDEWAEIGVRSPRHLGGVGVSFVVSVPDADATFAKAVEAGARVDRPVRDEPYGRAAGSSTPGDTTGTSSPHQTPNQWSRDPMVRTNHHHRNDYPARFPISREARVGSGGQGVKG